MVYVPKRKVIVEVDINDDRINSIKDLEQEILTHDIYGQIAWKYFDNLQADIAQRVNVKKGQFSTGIFNFVSALSIPSIYCYFSSLLLLP